MKDNFSDVEQRVKRYWYTDGIGELMGGGMFLLIGLYFSAQQYFGDQSPVGVSLQSSFVILLVGGIFIGRWVVNRLKARLTYPRTGYVEYRLDDKHNMGRRIFTFAIAMGVAMFSVFIARSINTIDSMVALTGLLVSVILLVKQGWSAGVGRFYVLSALALILGIVLSVSGLARGYNLGMFYGLLGIAFAISGGLTLRRYLRENPLPAEDPMGDDLRSVTELDRLIHEPARLLIVTILSSVASADFLFLQRETGLTKGNLSAHLSKLEEAGYVRIEKTFKGKFPLTVCKLTLTGQKALKAYRQQLQSFMDKTS